MQHMLHQIKAQQFYTYLDLHQQCKAQKKTVKFKDFSNPQGRFNIEGLFKKALYIQVLFKPVQTLVKMHFGDKNNNKQTLLSMV